MTKLKVTEDWRDKSPERFVRWGGRNQLAGVFAVNGTSYWCSLVELDTRIIEFMTFWWDSHLGDVASWNNVFVKQMIQGETQVTINAERFPANIDERTFKSCMEEFEVFLQSKVDAEKASF